MIDIQITQNFSVETLKAGFIQQIKNAVNSAVLFGEAAIVRDTPVDTSFLQNNWKHEEAKQEGSLVYAIIYNNTKYAPYIEYGTRKMKPFMMVRKNIPKIDKQLKDDLERIKI